MNLQEELLKIENSKKQIEILYYKIIGQEELIRNLIRQSEAVINEPVIKGKKGKGATNGTSESN